MPENKKFWKFCNQAGNKVELLLYGDISQTSWWGDEVTPKQFAEELAGLGALDEITVRINSGGGDVFAAQAIGNQLEQHPAAVTAKIDGLCASAATIVACHCGKVIAATDSTYMVHPVRMGAYGYYNAEELQKYIEAMNAIRESIVGLYVKKTGRDIAPPRHTCLFGISGNTERIRPSAKERTFTFPSYSSCPATMPTIHTRQRMSRCPLRRRSRCCPPCPEMAGCRRSLCRMPVGSAAAISLR